MAGHALFGRWPRAGSATFGDLIVTAATVAMKSLLIVQSNCFSVTFNFDLRNVRQQLWFHPRSSMTIGTSCHRWRTGVFLEEIGSQRCSPIRRPRSLVWRMFDYLRGRLRGVMTLYTSNGLGSVNTAVLRGVIEMVKLHATQLGLRREH